jgi:anti-sigma factor RsiW
MSGECGRIREMMVELASGGLGDAERAEVERHLEACPGCAEERDALERLFAVVRDDGYAEPSPFYWTRFGASLRRRLEGGGVRSAASGWQRAVPRLAPAAVALACFAAGLWLGLRPAPGVAPVAGGPIVTASYEPAREAPVISPQSKLLVESGRDGHPVYAADTLRPNALMPFGDSPEMVLASSPRLAIMESGLGQRSLGR